MKQLFIGSLLICLLLSSCGMQNPSSDSVITPVNASDKQIIIEAMTASKEAWNQGDMEGYMDVYWKSDSLRFMGLKSITKGYHQTLANYKKGYPDAATRGTLSYTFNHFNQLAPDCILVIGQFHLKREIGDAEGYFSLIWKKVNDKWKIILDHTLNKSCQLMAIDF